MSLPRQSIAVTTKLRQQPTESD